MQKLKVCLCTLLGVCLLSGCRVDTNKNGYELLPFDVKAQESSLDDIEERMESDYQHILGSGTTNPRNNNTTVTTGSGAHVGTDEGVWAVRGGVGNPYDLAGGNKIYVTSFFGKRGAGAHSGMDLNLFKSDGTRVHSPDILSVTDGVVVRAEFSSSAGNWVIVESYRTNGEKFYVIYMHMLDGSLKVKAGQQISRGTKIGKEGNTGQSQGAHLHLQVCESSNQAATVSGRKNYNPLLVLYGVDINAEDKDKFGKLPEYSNGAFMTGG